MEFEALIDRGRRHHEKKGSINYSTAEGEQNTVNWQEYPPQGPALETPGRKPGIFFSPGWAVTEGGLITGYTTRKISRLYADFTGTSTFAMKIRGNPVTLEQMPGAQAERQFIEDRGFTDATFIGNSQGGIPAIESAYLLQEKSPDTRINGLILLSSMALSEQTGQNEAFTQRLPSYSKGPNFLDKHLNDPGSNFFDRLFNDPGSKILQDPKKNWKILLPALMMQTGVTLDFLRQVWEAHGDIPGGIENLREEMIHTSELLSKIKAPVVFVHGEAETMSPPDEILKKELGIEGARQYIRRLGEYQKQKKESLAKGSDHNFMQDPEYMKIKGVLQAREEHVLRELCPNSRGVRVIIADAKNHGHHALGGYRPEDVVRSSMAAVERLNRRGYDVHGKEEFKEYAKDRRRFTQPPLKKAA